LVSKAQAKFRGLLPEVDSADEKILSLFPSLDYHRTGLEVRTVAGLRTALRVLLVAIEQRYVNDQLLVNEYAVGGDSRRRVLPQLLDLRVLSRKEELSEKKVKRYRYALADKGVILSAAFRHIFKSDRYVELIRDNVTNESLAQVLMILHHQPRPDRKNPLLETLHSLSDRGLNFERVSEADLTNLILSTESSTTQNSRERQLFELLETVVDELQHASQEEVTRITEVAQKVPDFIELARSEPIMTKRLLILTREMMQFLTSSDFQMYLMTHRDPSRLKGIVLDTIRTEIGPIRDLAGEDGLAMLWGKRRGIVETIQRRLREETYSKIIRTQQKRTAKKS
jgi:hypothetical protein